MIYAKDQQKYYFASGREIYSPGGFVGIHIDTLEVLFSGHTPNGDLLTRSEIVEVAEFMIDVWRAVLEQNEN